MSRGRGAAGLTAAGVHRPRCAAIHSAVVVRALGAGLRDASPLQAWAATVPPDTIQPALPSLRAPN